jgi:hypothetical protein
MNGAITGENGKIKWFSAMADFLSNDQYSS